MSTYQGQPLSYVEALDTATLYHDTGDPIQPSYYAINPMASRGTMRAFRMTTTFSPTKTMRYNAEMHWRLGDPREGKRRINGRLRRMRR